MSHGRVALGCDVSQVSQIAADRGQARSAKGNPTPWSAACARQVPRSSTRWLVRHLTIVTGKRSADVLLLFEQT
jgi:hypothetical protein